MAGSLAARLDVVNEMGKDFLPLNRKMNAKALMGSVCSIWVF